MTSETKTLIQIDDIEGIELECSDCKAKIFYPLENNHERIVTRCPNCNGDLFLINQEPFNRGSVAVEQIKMLVRAIKSLKTPTDMKAHLRFQVTISPKE